MTETDLSLLVAAILVSLLSWRRNRRGVLWICVAALSYLNGDLAWRLGLPYAEALTGFGDAGVCLAVYIWGREKWESAVWRLYLASMAVSGFYLAGNLGVFVTIPHDVYSILMELVNWLLLLLIAGISILRMVGANDVGSLGPLGRLYRLSFHARRERAARPLGQKEAARGR